jgi:hypothetical protein
MGKGPLDVSNSLTDRIVCEFGYKGNWYFFEHDAPSVNRCMSFSTILYAPQIELSMIGPAWTFAKGNSVVPIMVVRSDSDLPTSVVNVDPEKLRRDLTLRGFQEGESFQLPGAPHALTIKSTGSTSAVFTLAKN